MVSEVSKSGQYSLRINQNLNVYRGIGGFAWSGRSEIFYAAPLREHLLKIGEGFCLRESLFCGALAVLWACVVLKDPSVCNQKE